MLVNCETWHGFKHADITQPNFIDHQLLRYICRHMSQTPVEFLFLEAGAIPQKDVQKVLQFIQS